MIAILAVVVVAAGGAGIALAGAGPHDNGQTGSIVLTDSNGEEKIYTYNGTTLNKISLINKHSSQWAQILGMTDLIVGVGNTTWSKENSVIDKSLFTHADNIGETNKSGFVEKIVQYGTQLVISPVKQGVSKATEDKLAEYGIPVVYLNCYGESMLSDAAQMAKIGGTAAQAIYNEYLSNYNAVLDEVYEKSADLDVRILAATTSSDGEASKGFGYYIEISEWGKVLNSIHTTNVITSIGTPVPGKTTYADCSTETVIEEDGNNGIDFILLRTISSTPSLEGMYNKYCDTFSSYGANKLNVVKAHNVYSIENELMSGCRDHFGLLLVAKILGCDITSDIIGLVNEFNEKYGLPGEFEHIAYHGTYDDEPHYFQ